MVRRSGNFLPASLCFTWCTLVVKYLTTKEHQGIHKGTLKHLNLADKCLFLLTQVNEKHILFGFILN
jgi:hypothetical protein